MTVAVCRLLCGEGRFRAKLGHPLAFYHGVLEHRLSLELRPILGNDQLLELVVLHVLVDKPLSPFQPVVAVAEPFIVRLLRLGRGLVDAVERLLRLRGRVLVSRLERSGASVSKWRRRRC